MRSPLWSEGFDAYLSSYEVRLHRRRDTFSGALWPDPRPGLIPADRQMEIALAAIERRSA